MSGDICKAGLLLLCALGTGIGHASQSLLSFYSAARDQSPELQAARLSVGAAIEKREQAWAARRPSIRLLSDASRQVGASAFSPGPYQDRGVHNWSWNLQMSQALLRPGARDGVEQAELEISRAAAELQSSEQALMIRVSQAVLDSLTAQRDVDVLVTHQHAVEQQVQLARHNFQAGLTPITDVHEASAQLHFVAAQLAQARSTLAQRRADMEQLLGPHASALPIGLVRLATGTDVAVALADEFLNIDDHPTLVAQRLALRVAEIEVQKQARAHGPVADLTLGYGRNASTGSLTAVTDVPVRSQAAQVGVRVTIPLYEGGLVSSRVREAALLREKAEVDLRLSSRQIRTQASQAMAALTHETQRVHALTLAHQASADAVSANRVGYRVGTRIGLDVLNAEQQRFGAERDLYKANAERLMHSLRLKAARGVLAERDLSIITMESADAAPARLVQGSKEKP